MINPKKYLEFVYKHNGFYREYNYDKYRNQCMDIFWIYLKEVCGIDPSTYQGWGTPANLWNNTHKIKDFNKNFTKILNSADNVPQQGDIMFYKYYPLNYGIAGHVEMFDHPEGDGLYTFVTFSQNWTTGKPCKFVRRGSGKILHGYRGCLGWIRRK